MTLVPAALCIEQAIQYGQKGWKVQGIPPGKQHPAVDGWENRAASDPGAIRGLFASRDLWQGISILTGPASGIFVVDVDVADGKAGEETLLDLEHQYGTLPDTYEVITARGGRHLYYRWNPTFPVRNDAGIRLGPGLDVRGEGGQVVAPPAYSSKPGWENAPYEIDLGGHDEAAEAPLWLLELLCAPPAAEPRRQRPEGARSGAPGDIFDATHTWPELLEADGAQCIAVRHDRASGSGYELWARPGVDDHHGATLYYGGSDVLKVFTSSWPGLDEGRTYSRFGYYAATRHGGDHSAAARQLREEGYVEEAPRWATEVGQPAPASDSEWPDPLPWPERTIDPWPVDVLPDWIRTHVEVVATKLQVPPDLCAQVALGVLSTMCTGYVQMEVDRGWREHLNLYLVTAMLSGTGKSPAVKAMVAPVYALEKELRDQIGGTISSLEREKAILIQRAKNLEKVAAAGSPDAMRDYLQALAAAEEIDVPVLPVLLADDATPEVLAKMMANHRGRMSVISPEAELFDMVQGAYARKTNINIYLKGWGGEPVRINRKGGQTTEATALEIEEALLSVCVAVQPHVLENVARDEELRGRGFTTRFMPCVPADLLGLRNPMERRQAPAPGDEYTARMVALGGHVRRWSMPLILTFDADAQNIFDDWQAQLELRMNRNGELRQVAEWVSKIMGSVARTAGLLQMAEGLDREPVGVDVVRRAIRLGDYWIRQAVWLTTGLWEGAAIDVPRCERVLRWVVRTYQPGEPVPVSSIRRAMKWSSEELEEVIEDLSALSRTIYAPSDGVRKVGRPKSPDLLFHPLEWGAGGISAPFGVSARGVCTTTTTTPPPHPPYAEGSEGAETLDQGEEGGGEGAERGLKGAEIEREAQEGPPAGAEGPDEPYSLF